MATLKSMFPDFETGVLRAVLYKTNGHMERTVELLLNMQNELQQTQVVTKNVDDVDDVRHTLEPDFLVYNISYSDDSTNVRSSVQQDLEDLKLAQSLQRQYNIEQGLEQAGLGIFDINTDIKKFHWVHLVNLIQNINHIYPRDQILVFKDQVNHQLLKNYLNVCILLFH